MTITQCDMDKTHDHQSQLALAFYAGVLQGVFRSWRSLNRPWRDFLSGMAKKGRKLSDYDIFVHHGSALLSLRVSLKGLKPPFEGELARTLLLAAMESEIEALQAAMGSGEEHIQEHAQHLADAKEDTQAFDVALRSLWARAGLSDDAFDI
jgi:hypothetical protein